MAKKIMDAVTAVGVSKAQKVGHHGIVNHTLDISFNDTVANEASDISALVVSLCGSVTGEDKDTGMISRPALAIGSTAENVKTGTFNYQIDNVSYSKTTVAAGTAILAGLDGLSTTVGDYTVALAKFGGFKVYINASGTLGFAFPALTQSYATIALANAAVDALPSRYAGNYIEIGKILIDAKELTAWTAGTSDLTDTSDVDFANFISVGSSFHVLATKTFDATELLEGRALFTQDAVCIPYIRAYVSTLTGTGSVTITYANDAGGLN